MLQYIAKRLLGLIPTMVIVGILVFMLVHLLPGDPARLAAGPDATPETVQLVRRDLGLNIVCFAENVEVLGGLVNEARCRSSCCRRRLDLTVVIVVFGLGILVLEVSFR